jgi:hypothetical protein
VSLFATLSDIRTADLYSLVSVRVKSLSQKAKSLLRRGWRAGSSRETWERSYLSAFLHAHLSAGELSVRTTVLSGDTNHIAQGKSFLANCQE